MSPKPRTPNSAPAATLVERFDYAALSYIIANFDDFPFRDETPAEQVRELVSKYKATSNVDGSRVVKYRRSHGPDHGRCFAEGGMSMQQMAREVRNAVAHRIYHDVDIHNAQPSLLKQFCERNMMPCPQLQRYCADRQATIAELEAGDAPGSGKTAIIAVMNGGAAVAEQRGIHVTPWLTAFEHEMCALRESILTSQVGAPYVNIVRELGRAKGTSKVMRSAMSLLLNDLEHNALMAMHEFFNAEGRTVGVLVFDGLMVQREPGKDELSNDVLQRASDFVLSRTGYHVRLAVKDMTKDRFMVPDAVYTGFHSMSRAPRYAVDDEAAGTLFLGDIAPFTRSCNSRVYVRVGRAWTAMPAMTNKVLLARCLGANIQRITEDGISHRMSGNVPAANRILAAALALMPDDPTFEHKMWLSTIGVTCFANGLWDWRQRRFFTYDERDDVFPAHVVPRDFPIQRPGDDTIQELYTRILLSTLSDPLVVQTYLQLIARATAGEYTDKQWAVCIGERDCGKGLLQELNTACWGNGNVNSIHAESFLLQQHAPADAAKSMSWALDCQFARQTYTNEVRMDRASRSIKLDGNRLKQFQSGGDTLTARKNYTDEREFKLQTHLFMNMNDMPEVTPRDALSTMLMFKFPHKFVSAAVLADDPLPFFRLRDDGLKEWIRHTEVLDAFTWLVIDAYLDKPVVPCEKVRHDTDGFREDAGDDLLLMKQHFKITGRRTDFVTIQQLRDWVIRHNISVASVKDRLKRMGAKEDKNCNFGGKSHGRGFIGVQLIAQDNDDHLDAQSTESTSEALFRVHLVNATGRPFDSARPEWLINTVTGCAMELDMYNSKLGVAVEYDGPQHYEFPNRYHRTRNEFDAQQARDRLKERLCKIYNVKLYRVRAVGNVVAELASLKAQVPDLFPDPEARSRPLRHISSFFSRSVPPASVPPSV